MLCRGYVFIVSSAPEARFVFIAFSHRLVLFKAQQLTRRYWGDIPCSVEQIANQFQCLALKTIFSLKETISSRFDGGEVGSLSCGSCVYV